TAHPGEPVTLRFHFSMPAPVADPVLVASIHTLDGLEVSRPVVHLTPVFEGTVPPSGSGDLRIGSLPLLAGTYDITASIGEAGRIAGVPDRAHALRVTVERRPGNEEHGVVSLGGGWQMAARGVTT